MLADRPAPAHVRRRHAVRDRRRAPGRARRQAADPRRQRPRARPGRPGHRRRLGPDRARRRHGRRGHRGDGTRPTSVVIEAACFDALTVARTSRRHKLSSEASRRYERGVDPAAGYAAAHRAAALLVELGGGTLQAAETVVGTVPARRSRGSTPRCPSGSSGPRSSAPGSRRLLVAVGADVRDAGTASSLTVLPPSWRPDLRDPYDFVEEVGRLDRLRDHHPRRAARPARARAHPVAARPPGRHPARRGRCRRGAELPVPLARRRSTAGLGPPTTGVVR